MDREEYIQERIHWQKRSRAVGGSLGRTGTSMPSWWPGIRATVMFRTNLRHWLHAALPGPSEVPWQRFSWFYWYQKGCQEGFHGPNVREMAQKMITQVTDRLQQLPFWGANSDPMVWDQHSHAQLLLSPIPNHTERMWKLHQHVPGCSRDKHEGNSLADIAVQLWTLKPHLHLA